MKTIVKITMIGLFLFSFPVGSLAQGVENPRETVIENTWYLSKLVMDQEEYPFVPDDSRPNVPMEIYYLDEGETYGVIESEFCDQGEVALYLFTDTELIADMWILLASDRPLGVGDGYQNCNREPSDYVGNRADNYQYFEGFWMGYPDSDLNYEFVYEVHEMENGLELIVTNDNGDKAYFGDVPLSVPKSELSRISLYPNPVKDQLMVDNLTGPTDLEIYDLTGKVLFVQTLTEETTQIDLSFLAEGLYIYQLREGSHHKTGKLIKN